MNGNLGVSQESAVAGANHRTLRFVLIFVGTLLAAFGVLLTGPAQYLDARLSLALVKVAHGVLVGCGGYATRDDAILRAPGGFAVEMREGCNGINVTILLWSAILAFPARWRMKAIGLIAGSLIIQVLNIARFISLFYLGQYSLTWFDFAHTYLWESMLVLDTMVIFWLWVNRVVRLDAAACAPV
jgi:exosortase H (IPTLxxWG-CTERM-specific)